MSYLILLLLLSFVLGVVGVASNPSPYFGTIGLVVVAASGCILLVGFGCSFVSLILFLIYLGGMLVVFAYSVALSAEAYPEDWWDWSVIIYVLGYGVLIFTFGFVFVDVVVDGLSVDGESFYDIRADFSGVILLYLEGGPLLLLCGGGLLLALFVVLEVTRGVKRGALRVV
uniref:NADH dehydrogenase subunit 6 n=1 Tax=Goniurosaurus bawanglingensis TaxID=2234022 RepID=UPI002A7F4029|nr:NADH dehydrogenase subunit 6 [Goniurosaurus bawanglingensis]WOA02158.1 NADH dehydrogenase subunit 6 [Goniurosaurus bawanglingensis]